MNTIISTSTNNPLIARHIAVVSLQKNSAYVGVAKAMLIEEAKRQMRNGVCHFLYLKKDGSVREAFGTLAKPVLNATLKGTGESPETWGCCYYHDVIKGSARSFRWSNLIDILS